MVKTSNRNKKTQMTLDFGQKKFGSTRCSDCGMLYTIGDPDDAKAHSYFHKQKLDPVVKVPRSQHRIVREYFDGSHIVELQLDTKGALNLFARIKNLMNRDLGLDQSIEVTAQNADETDFHTFVYVLDRTQLVVGCCIAELLTSKKIQDNQYKVRRLEGGRQNLLSWRIQNQSTTHSSFVRSTPSNSAEITGPICGIRRLWVAKEHRRRKIATCLVDSVLQNLIYGCQIPRSHVAFTEPTANGADFAVSFVNCEDILIY